MGSPQLGFGFGGHPGTGALSVRLDPRQRSASRAHAAAAPASRWRRPRTLSQPNSVGLERGASNALGTRAALRTSVLRSSASVYSAAKPA